MEAIYLAAEAMKYINDEEYERAIELLDIAIELEPNNRKAWFLKGLAYSRKGNHEKASDCFKKKNEFNVEQKIYIDTFAIDDLVGETFKLFQGDTSIYDHYYRGIHYHGLKDYEKSLECFAEAKKTNPFSPLPLNGMANVYQELDRYEEALDCYEKAINLDKADPSNWNGKGNVYKKLGEYSKALASYEIAIKLDRNYAKPWNGIGTYYLTLSNSEMSESQKYYTAQRYFKRALLLEFKIFIFRNYLITWQYYPKHPFFLQDILQEASKSLYLTEQVATMCQDINLWLKYLNKPNWIEPSKSKKSNKEISKVQKTQSQALINYFMGHPSKTFHILKDNVIPQNLNNLQAYYYLVMSCHKFLENEEPYLEEALEIAEQYRQPLPKQKKKGISRLWSSETVIVPSQDKIVERYYAALIFWIDEELEMALECISELWDRVDFLPLIYLYYQLRFEQEKSKSPDKEWSKQEERGLLYADPFPKIAQYILIKEAKSTEKYASGFTHHSIDPKREDWWQPLYHYAHYREISGAINLLHLQAVSHLNRKDVVAADDAKYFWEIFTIVPQNITLMSEEIRKAGLKKVGQAFLSYAEEKASEGVDKVDMDEEELRIRALSILTQRKLSEGRQMLRDLEDIRSVNPDWIANEIASKIESGALKEGTETYEHLISYFVLQGDISPKDSIYLRMYAMYVASPSGVKVSKASKGGLKAIVKSLSGETVGYAIDILAASNPVTALLNATLKPFAKGSMGELFGAFMDSLNQSNKMSFGELKEINLEQVPSFKDSFLEFVGKEKERLGKQFEQTYPLYGYEDWLEK